MSASVTDVGVDIGTTAVKAVAYDPAGSVLEAVDREYPLRSPHPDHAEQDPDEVLEVVTGALRDVARACRDRNVEVRSVTFSAAMHSLLALDDRDRPLTPALTFADGRARAQADHIAAELDGAGIYRHTGTPIHPMSPLTKLRWFADQDPEVAAAARRWVSLKEYVLFRLFDELVVDLSIASATGLLELATGDWYGPALEVARVERTTLSPIVPTTHRLQVSAERLAALELPPGTAVVVGANDGVLANLGVGAVGDDVAACSIGTSGAVRVTTDRPRTDPGGRTFCYALTEDHWIVGGAINNGGVLLRWVRDELLPDVAADARERGVDPYAALVELAGRVGPGAGGLVLLPYLLGERAPHWSGLPRGVLFGLRRQHRREHLVRAVLEGVVFQLYSVVKLLDVIDVHPTGYLATGGAVTAPLWRQIVADVFDARVVVPDRQHGSSYGAAVLGAYAIGALDRLEDATADLGVAHEHRPDAEATRVYHRLHGLFERLYDRLEPEFAEHASIQTELLLADEQRLPPQDHEKAQDHGKAHDHEEDPGADDTGT